MEAFPIARYSHHDRCSTPEFLDGPVVVPSGCRRPPMNDNRFHVAHPRSPSASTMTARRNPSARADPQRGALDLDLLMGHQIGGYSVVDWLTKRARLTDVEPSAVRAAG